MGGFPFIVSGVGFVAAFLADACFTHGSVSLGFGPKQAALALQGHTTYISYFVSYRFPSYQEWFEYSMY